MDFSKSLREVVKIFEKNNIKYCLAGGVAVVYYGVSRGTTDLDFFVSVDRFELDSVVRAFEKEQDSVLPYKIEYGFLQVEIEGRRVDIIPYFTNEETRALNNAKYRNIFGTRCKMIRLEDLLLLKLSISSTEERDLEDVKLICMYCKDRIDKKYLKEGIRALNMERYKPFLSELLDVAL